MINHRKPWTLEEETKFVEFMLNQIRHGKRIYEAIEAANIKFNRKNCADRWKRYGLGDLYAEELQEAKFAGEIARARLWGRET